MKKAVYILVLILCCGLSACRSQKEAVSAVAGGNPYLIHYLSTSPDSLQRSAAAYMERKKDELNLKRLHKKVNPDKNDDLWGDIIRDILESIFAQKH